VNDPGPPDAGHSASAFSVSDDEVTCRQFVELVTDYFEESLPARTLGQVEEHLVLCDWCVTYAEQMEATIDVLQALREPVAAEPSASVLQALAARRRLLS
jgi:anti-sigma factor RsiW